MDPSVFVLQPYAVVATMVSVLVAAFASRRTPAKAIRLSRLS